MPPPPAACAAATRQPPAGAWGIVLGSFIAHVFALGTLYSFGVLMDPLMAEFNASTALVASVGSVGAFLFAFLAPLTVPVVARYGVRTAVAGGAVLAVVALLGSSVANSIYLVLALYGVVLGFAYEFMWMPAMTFVPRYFAGTKNMSLAQGIAVAGAGVGQAGVSALLQSLIGYKGWRFALRVLALVLGCCMACAACLLKPLPPSAAPAKPPPKAMALNKLILGSPMVKFLMPIFVFMGIGFYTPFHHIVKYATLPDGGGISDSQAAGMMVALGFANTVGRVLSGKAADQWGVMVVFPVFMVAAGLIVGCLTLCAPTPYTPFIRAYTPHPPGGPYTREPHILQRLAKLACLLPLLPCL